MVEYMKTLPLCEPTARMEASQAMEIERIGTSAMGRYSSEQASLSAQGQVDAG